MKSPLLIFNLLLILVSLGIYSTANAQKNDSIRPYEILNRPFVKKEKKGSLGKLIQKPRLDSIIEKEINYLTKNYKNTYKRALEYDKSGNNKIYDFYLWIDSLELWRYNSQIINRFDKNNNKITSESFNWDNQNEELTPAYFDEYKHNSKNQKTSYIYSFANEFTNNRYVKYGNGNSEYNSKGSLIAENDSTLDVFFNELSIERKEYLYNEQEKETIKYTYYLSEATKKFFLSNKKENIYDGKSNLTNTTNYGWFSANDSVFFKPRDITENYYNSKAQKTLTIFWQYNQDEKKLLPYTKTEIYYDPDGNTEMELISYFYNNDWVLGTRNIYSYNLNYLVSDIIDVYDETYPVFHINMLLEINVQFLLNNSWNNYQQKTFHYSTNQFDVEEVLETVKLKIYPNPTMDYLKVQTNSTINSIAIFDLFGREVNAYKSTNTINRVTLDLSNLSNGSYIIQIQCEDGSLFKNPILKVSQ